MSATKEKMRAVLEEISSVINHDMDSGRGNTDMLCGFTDMEVREDDEGNPEAICFMNCGMAACLREIPKDIAIDMEREYKAQRLQWAGEFVSEWNRNNPDNKLDENDPVSAIFDDWIRSCDADLADERLDKVEDSFNEWMDYGHDTDVMLAFRFSEDDDDITLSMIVNRKRDVFPSFNDETRDHITVTRDDFLKIYPEMMVNAICFDRHIEEQPSSPGMGN